jgi:hypothetical protein
MDEERNQPEQREDEPTEEQAEDTEGHGFRMGGLGPEEAIPPEGSPEDEEKGNEKDSRLSDRRLKQSVCLLNESLSRLY